MKTTWGESDNLVADTDLWAIDNGVLFNDANGKTSEIVLILPVEIRHLSGFSADKRTLGLPASFGYAGDDISYQVEVHAADGQIIQKEKRPGSLDQDVVNTHGHQVDAHGIVLARQESDFELGTYSVCGAHKNWLLVAKVAEGIETAESSHIGDNTGVEGGFNERSNPVYQFIGSV